MSFAARQHSSYDPVSPTDFTRNHSPAPLPRASEDSKDPRVLARSRTSSSSSTAPSLRTPRTARFAEATAVHSPIEPSTTGKSPFADPPNMANQEAQPSDVGFGYIAANDASIHTTYPAAAEANSSSHLAPPTPGTPLRSALKSPGTPGRRFENPLSPTFREEQILEKHEGDTEKENAKDLKVKTRVRAAKMLLRGVNFSCSLIVLSMLATTFSIFNATKHLPPRNGLPSWAAKSSTWPQITLLCIACVSLVMSVIILGAYWRGGHKRAEKAAVYYTVFAVAFFVFSIIMWGIGAGILNGSKLHGNNKDVWGWSCIDNKRRKLFENDVSYALICRLQNWSLICCIVEIVVETITIAIYGIVFYRFYSKRKLRKSMDLRDKARSDLYLAQLRSQSAPNTPGYAQTPMSPHFPPQDPHSAAENGEYYGTQYAQKHHSFSQPKPFALQPPPIRVQNATPQVEQDGFQQAPQHAPSAPGEQQYAAVPIPGAYSSPAASPAYPPPMQINGAPGQAVTTERRVESPPSSPRLPHPH
ncbi:MAG: hypothetical protein M1835_004872 [Candelina submexicana]|nr:MAG: hypothetical protein M1835_004872 [Candelina submexicana]